MVIFETPISENDADQIYVDTLNIVGNVLNTDTVEIVEPALRFVGDATNQKSVITLLGKSSGIEGGFADACTFLRLAFSTILHFTGIPGVQFDRVHFEGPYGMRALGSSVVASVNCTCDRGMTLTGFSTYQPYLPLLVPAPLSTKRPTSLCRLRVSATARRPFGLYIGAFVQKPGSVGTAPTSSGPPVASYGSALDGLIGVTCGSFFGVWSSTERLRSTAKTIRQLAGIRSRWNSTARVNGGQYTTITGAVGDLHRSRPARRSPTAPGPDSSRKPLATTATSRACSMVRPPRRSATLPESPLPTSPGGGSGFQGARVFADPPPTADALRTVAYATQVVIGSNSMQRKLKIRRVGGAQAEMAKSLGLTKVTRDSAKSLWDSGQEVCMVGNKVNSHHFFGGWRLAYCADPSGRSASDFNRLANSFGVISTPSWVTAWRSSSRRRLSSRCLSVEDSAAASAVVFEGDANDAEHHQEFPE